MTAVGAEPDTGTGSTSPGADSDRRPPDWIPGEPGVWVLILGDMVVFALFFGMFIYERSHDVALFNASRDTLDTALGALNTFLLLTSSLMVVLGVHALRGQTAALSRLAQRLFAGAFACGLGFSLNKYIEWSGHIQDGQTPSTNEFYTLYFVLTGIHFLHLLIGMGVLIFLWGVARRGASAPRDLMWVESGASFWHLVDLLWVVLFPLLYLVG